MCRMRLITLRTSLASSLILTACGSVKNELPDAGVVPSVDKPVNEMTAGTVDEGATMSLASRLVSTDADTPISGLTYTLVSLPGDGTLLLDGTPLDVSGTFTQKDVTDGKVSYKHGGSPDGGDSFDWQLTDGTNALATTTFAITVTPTNDAPLVVNNPTSTIAEGGIEVLTPERLSASDEEGGTITYTYVSAVRGELQRRVGAAPFVAMTAGQTFTVQDIADGNVRYVDPGTDDAMLAVQQSTAASFSWRMDDGQGGIAPSATGAFISDFTITSVDDAPVVAWKTQRCSSAFMNVLANPITTLADPDNTLAQYTVCVVSIGAGTNVTPSTTAMAGVTTTPMPVLQNGATSMGVGDCVTGSLLNSLNLDAPTNPNTTRGYVTFKLMKNGVQWLTNQTVTFPATPASC